MVALKTNYLALLKEGRKSRGQSVCHVFLAALSFLYAFIVAARNFLYARKIMPVHTFPVKIISVGNITWSGTGKTSLVMLLHKEFSKGLPTVTVTKGYARDEYLLLKERLGDVLDSRDRVRLVKENAGKYSLFILDDGFQYRSLGRDVDIVLIKKDDVRSPRFLIPASPYREPLSGICRADIVIVTYCSPGELPEVSGYLRRIHAGVKVFSAGYRVRALFDRGGKEVPAAFFLQKKTAVLTAIGYPEGFTRTVTGAGITVGKVIEYPDHHQFSSADMKIVERDLIRAGVTAVIISRKDFYHIDFTETSLPYYVLDAEFVVDEQEKFLQEVRKCMR